MEQPANSTTTLAGCCLHQLRLFFIALQFFTRLPIPNWVGYSPTWLQAATRYFPAVGIVVGIVTAGSYALFIAIWPQMIAVLLSTVLGVYLTGALHEDGFADTCDGFGGGYTTERVLEIMKDSRIGAYGAIGIGMLLAIKCVTLAYLPVWSVMSALLVAHPLSRLASATLIWRLQYVKAEGRAKPFAQQMTGREFGIAGVSVLLPVAALFLYGALSWQALTAGMLAVVLATFWLARIFVRRIGGYTGDCLGAVQQASEIAFYLGLLATVSP